MEFSFVHCNSLGKCSNIALTSTPGLPKSLFPVGLPVKILTELLPSSIFGKRFLHVIF